MPPFTKTCVALAWTSSGQCYGVRMQGTAERCRVLASWQSGPESGESISGKLIAGAAELKAANVDQVVVGGSSPAGGFMDITVPALREDEQAQALRYELVKYCPLSLDKIDWGYRIIGKTETGQQHVRLFYFPQEDWENCIEAVRGVVSGVDILISPVGALDPVLTGYDVCLPAEGGLWYRDTGNGFRDCAAEPGQGAKQFGAPDAPLEADGLEPGVLQERSGHEQSLFTSAVVLGMYGLFRRAEKDKKTWLHLPPSLRPRRHRVAQTVAVLLALYLVGFGGFQAAKYGLAALNHYQTLQQRKATLEQKIDDLSAPEEQREKVENVKEQLQKAAIDRPSLGACLLSLTTRTGKESWVRRFSWDDGKMSLEVVTQKESVNLTDTWEKSPVLADVVPRRKKIDSEDRTIINYRLYASYENEDSAEEQEEESSSSP